MTRQDYYRLIDIAKHAYSSEINELVSHSFSSKKKREKEEEILLTKYKYQYNRLIILKSTLMGYNGPDRSKVAWDDITNFKLFLYEN